MPGPPWPGSTDSGDADGDGYVEYACRNPKSRLVNQCWKDSWDAIQFADGTLARGPIATCEIQGYVCYAKRRTARLARDVWGDETLTRRPTRQVLGISSWTDRKMQVITMDDEAIRTVVRRLARPHASGGNAIERSVILAEGSDSTAIIAWVLSHAGVPDSTTATASKRGIHGSRVENGAIASDRPPLRFLLPAGSLD